MDEFQVDTSCMVEPNLDLNKPEVKDQIFKRLKKIDPHAKLAKASSPSIYNESNFKMGGSVMVTRGNWAGHIVKQGCEKLGRWTYQVFEGKDGKRITIMNVYRVGKSYNASGNCTIRNQQEKDLLVESGIHQEPREQILIDLKKRIDKLHEKGHIVIIFGDFNEDVEGGKRIQKFLMESNLKNCVQEKHDGKLPRTHDRGKHCIDMIAVLKALDNDAIKQAGYLPFYEGIATNHRAVFVDLDAEYLFTNTNQDTTKPMFRRFTTDQPKKADKYLKTLEEELEKARIFRKVNQLEIEMNEYLDKGIGDESELIRRCINLSEKTSQLMTYSERKVGRKHYSNGYPSSPKLKNIAQEIIEMKKILRSTSINETGESEKIKMVKWDLKEKYKELRQAQKISKELRKSHLDELAMKRSQQWKMSASQAAAVIKESEESKETHRKHKRFLKPAQGGAIKELYVPYPQSEWKPQESDITNEECQIKVSDQKEIFNILMRQNFKQLTKSKQSPFVQGKLHEKIIKDSGWIESFLEGNDRELEEVTEEGSQPMLKSFIKAMARPHNAEGTQVKTFRWKYGLEEYKQTFSKTRESTACGPSGLHMSHWKVAMERDCIASLHAFFIWASFQFSFTYPRWEVSWHCMLQKKKFPFTQKLRIIQLFEGDFNGGLKFLLGRRLMQHATKEGVLDEDTYGSRKGRNATEALVNLQMIFDDSRLWKKNFAMLFNDADGCYDRIAPVLAEIAIRRLGCPSEIAKTVTNVLQNMRHYVKTSTGISKGYIKYGKKQEICVTDGIIIFLMGLIGGTGQGSGASPIIWLSILVVMIMVYKRTNKGVEIVIPKSGKKIPYHIVSYVDDNTIVKNFGTKESINEILESMKRSLMEWNVLLKITGGGLSLTKCKLSVLKWRGNYWGIQRPEKCNADQTIHVPSEELGDKEVLLERLSPYEAERILGLRLPIMGTMQKEYKFRRDQAEKFALKMYRAPINHKEAFLIYQARYKPMIQYCMPVTQFTTEELHNIQRKFIYLLLPKLGINRHCPREVVYGPVKYGGRGLMDTRLEQPIIHLKTTIGHMRRGGITGKALEASLSGHQIVAGVSKPFYEYDEHELPYLPQDTRWVYTWKVLKQYRLQIALYDEWLPPKLYENDKNLMDTAICDPYFQHKRWKLEIINMCRVYLRVFTLGEIAHGTNQVDPGYIYGTKRMERNDISFEEVVKPPKSAWNEWKIFLYRNYITGKNVLSHQLAGQKTEVQRSVAGVERDLQIIKRGRLIDTYHTGTMTLKEIMGKVVFPEDDGESLIQAIMQEGLLGASDGSLARDGKNGGYAYSLQSNYHNEGRLMGGGKVPRSNDMSPLTSEMFGMLGTLAALAILCKHHNHIDYTGRKIVVTTDNIEVVDRVNNEMVPMNVSKTWCKEFDLWKLLGRIKSLIPLQVEAVWIKGHQDEHSNGKKLFGPFKREVEANVEMDILANQMRTDNTVAIYKRLIYSDTVMSIMDETEGMVNDISKYMYEKENGREMQTYILQKFNWCPLEQTLIHWDAMEKAMKTYSEYKKTKMVQLMFNWQNDGQQKALFHCSQTGECPTKCGEIETHHHYLECTDARMVQCKEKKINTVIQTLIQKETHPLLVITIRKYLKDGPEAALRNLEDKGNDPIVGKIKDAVEENLHLSQKSFDKGFTSKKWAEAQECWVTNQRGKKKKYQQWDRDLIIALQSYTYEMWKARNEILHGSNHKENVEKKKEKCRERIKELYRMDRSILSSEAKKLFRLPVNIQIKAGLSSMRQWIEHVEFIFQRAMEIEEKKKILWYFPIKEKRDIQTNKHTYKGKKQENIEQKKLTQTKIVCCRPRGG